VAQQQRPGKIDPGDLMRRGVRIGGRVWRRSVVLRVQAPDARRHAHVTRMLLVTLVLFGVATGAGAASPSPPLFALTGGALGSGSRLVALDPRTLEPRLGRSLRLPGWAFGREWAHSPEGDRIALVPKPSETNERLFVIRTVSSLRVLVRLPLPGEDVCRLVWPSARRLLLVLTRGAACYAVIEGARAVVIDPLRGRVTAQRPLSGRATIVATAQTRDGLVLLLARPGRRNGARLLLVAPAGTRTIPLPTLFAPPQPLDKSVLGSAIGLAVDSDKGRAYLVEPQGRVMVVNLGSGKVIVHRLSLRTTAAAAKGIARPVVQAVWLGEGLLAVTGVRREPNGRLTPVGLRLLNTHSWRSRLLDRETTGIAFADATILAFQPFFDQVAATPTGLRGYSLDGSLRFRAFAGQPVAVVRVQGRYAYAAAQGSGGSSVIDVRNGEAEPPDPDAISISPYELLTDAGF
jgi:hypothetical protein